MHRATSVSNDETREFGRISSSEIPKGKERMEENFVGDACTSIVSFFSKMIAVEPLFEFASDCEIVSRVRSHRE